MPRTRFHPRPVQKGERAGQSERLRGGDGPWRRAEQQVQGQQDAGGGVEAQIGGQGQLGPVRDHEALVPQAEGPVEDADEDLEGGRADGEGVFQAEEGGGGGQVGEDAGGEGEGGEGEADDGEELEVPAVGVVDGVGVVGEVFEGVEEGGEAGDLSGWGLARGWGRRDGGGRYVDEGGEGGGGGGGEALERVLGAHYIYSASVGDSQTSASVLELRITNCLSRRSSAAEWLSEERA